MLINAKFSVIIVDSCQTKTVKFWVFFTLIGFIFAQVWQELLSFGRFLTWNVLKQNFYVFCWQLSSENCQNVSIMGSILYDVCSISTKLRKPSYFTSWHIFVNFARNLSSLLTAVKQELSNFHFFFSNDFNSKEFLVQTNYSGRFSVCFKAPDSRWCHWGSRRELSHGTGCSHICYPWGRHHWRPPPSLKQHTYFIVTNGSSTSEKRDTFTRVHMCLPRSWIYINAIKCKCDTMWGGLLRLAVLYN